MSVDSTAFDRSPVDLDIFVNGCVYAALGHIIPHQLLMIANREADFRQFARPQNEHILIRNITGFTVADRKCVF